MKKLFCVLLIPFLVSATLFAQKNKPAISAAAKNVLNAQNIFTNKSTGSIPPSGFIKDRCGFVTQMNKAITGGFDRAAFEEVIRQKIEAIKSANNIVVTNYIIPVIFHVIHDGTAEGSGANIIASQIYEQIDQLNKDFGNLSGSPFGVAANTGLSFCPVLIDPSGTTLAQPGIDRIDRISKGWTDPTSFGSSGAQLNMMINYIDNTIKPNSIWNPSQYVNIWMYDFSNSGLLGYATFPTAGLPDLPGGGETATTAGIVFLNGAIGSVASPGTAGNYGLGRTVTHELGHFFGLYHTWGDEIDCSGTDYCADTPPCSDEYYSTVPGCIIPTQCSGFPRMVENYMDYSDDGCMNTFTLNQSDRLQAVMAASPRRPNNPGATICTAPVSNSFSFISNTTSITETGDGVSCPKFKDYNIAVKPAVAANGNATINFSFGGSAIQNIDYTIIGPASVNYINGESAAKNLTVRIIDDAAVESTESIIISYSISGPGLVPGTVNQTHTITITDDDVTYFINNASPVTTLLSENFGTAPAGGALPAGWIRGSFESPAGNNVFTVNAVYGAATGFTNGVNGRVLHITDGNSTLQSNETANTSYSTTSVSDAVVITNAINTSGFRNIKLTFDYACEGEEDAGTIYDFGLLRYSTTAQSSGLMPIRDINNEIILFQGKTDKSTVTVNLPAATANVPNLWLAFEWINDAFVGTDPPFIIDNIVVTGESSAVETVLSQSVTLTQNQNQAAQYMSNTNKIIAAVSSPDINIGCNTASIAAAGTGQTVLTTSSGSYLRSNKVIQLTPAISNITASYQATFYFTTAELAIWGSEVPDLKILKVKDGVDLGGTLTNSNSQVLTATVDDQRATKGYASFTGNFTGGFSQFMLASAITVVPVSLISFEARPDKKSIALKWVTTAETNNKGFVIERSIDGIRFNRIGWLNSISNIAEQKHYSFTDQFVQPDVVYHYRLRQTDFDNNEKLSEIRQAIIRYQDVTVSLSPNPAKDNVSIFIKGFRGRADINLLNARGQFIKSWKQLNISDSPQLLDISNISSGVYMIQVVNENAVLLSRLIVN